MSPVGMTRGRRMKMRRQWTGIRRRFVHSFHCHVYDSDGSITGYGGEDGGYTTTRAILNTGTPGGRPEKDDLNTSIYALSFAFASCFLVFAHRVQTLHALVFLCIISIFQSYFSTSYRRESLNDVSRSREFYIFSCLSRWWKVDSRVRSLEWSRPSH